MQLALFLDDRSADRPPVDSGAALCTNHRIAAALVELLARAGDRGASQRALQAAGGEDALSCGGWLPEKTLRAIIREVLREVPGDSRLARRVGRALVRSPEAGLLLRYCGIATPEKAYRRCNQILAREGRGARYEVAEMSGGRARVVFLHASGARPDAFYCGVRCGMLEGIPLVYGLLGARVREVECVCRGGANCVYDIAWNRNARHGLLAGALVGVAVGVGLAALASAPWWGLSLAGVAGGLVAAAAGRSFDLARQLEAVAGARRGQLALLDQADRSIAEKVDQLARLNAAGTAGDIAGPRHAPLGPGTPATGAGSSFGSEAVDLEAAELFPPVDLVALVRRAAESQRGELASGVQLELQLPDQAMWLDGESVELERAVVRLIRSAAGGETEDGNDSPRHVCVSLRATAESLELTVQDDGPEIEQETMDEIFDPFIGEGSSTAPRGLELAVAYSVVAQHGGELRLESTGGRGTRLTALLPRRSDGPDPNGRSDPRDPSDRSRDTADRSRDTADRSDSSDPSDRSGPSDR